MKPIAADVDALFNLSDSATIANLKTELPVYLAMDISPQMDALDWWQHNSRALPHWSAAAKKALLVQPSSAAAERAFSLLANSCNDRQQNALEDYVETSIIIQYNNH